jgi:hypothetical protein
MLGLIDFVVLTLLAVVLIFALPHRYRQVLLIAICGFWYVSGYLSGQFNVPENTNTPVDNSIMETDACIGSPAVLYKISEKGGKLINSFGSNNRQRFRNPANGRLSQSILHGQNKISLFSVTFSLKYYYFHNFIKKDQYISFLVRLKE